MLIGWPRAVLAGVICVFVFVALPEGSTWERLLGAAMGWAVIMAIPYLAIGLAVLWEKHQ